MSEVPGLKGLYKELALKVHSVLFVLKCVQFEGKAYKNSNTRPVGRGSRAIRGW